MLINRKIRSAYFAFILVCFSFIVFISLDTIVFAINDKTVQSYDEVLKNWQSTEVQEVKTDDIEIPASNFISTSSDAKIDLDTFEGKSKVLVWNNADGEVEYSFNAPADGLYNISMEYYILDDKLEPVERGILTGGKSPFVESKNFLFEKSFQNDIYPFKKNADDNEILPKQNGFKKWSTMTLVDRNSRYEEPFKFYFKQGENKITLTGLKGEIAISKIIIKAPKKFKNYDEYKNSLPNNKTDLNFSSGIEAENSSLKSGKNIPVLNISEPGLTPQTIGKKIFNTIGGDNWSNAHDWIEWEFEVPQDGIYNISLKYEQNFTTSLSSFRKIEIDGEVPFQELLSVSFAFGTSWQSKVLGDTDPYDLYLTQGIHKMRLTVNNAPYRNVQQELVEINNNLRELDLRIKEITGTNNDPSIDIYQIWNLKQYIPDLDSTLATYSKTILKQVEELSRITHNKSSSFNELIVASKDLQELSLDLEKIPKRTDSLSSIYTSMMNWTTNLDSQPLLLDKFMIKSKDNKFPSIKVSTMKKISYFVKNFFASFSNNNSAAGDNGEEAVQVWVQRNRDYVALMQQYADEYFTPETGIKINVNYSPGANLLVLANASGKQPDIATGVDMNTPFEFAMRGALVNLNEYPGYADLKKNMAPGALVPYHFDGSDFGLPEEVKYNVMFYREDILKRLKIEVPETWDDVVKVIPTLQQNNYNFFYPYGDFQTFFAQNNIDVYTKDGLDLAFDSPEGFKAFKFWTDLYVKYGLPLKMDSFYQHFRLGDVPIGITNVSQYIMFDLTSPDISGLWKIARIPGTVGKDGTIQRWQGGEQNGLMMFKTNQKRQDRSWQYLKWWMDTDTQAQFANDLENHYGPEFRWYSANIEVLKQQSWNDEAKKVLVEQLQWYKPIPFVPGGSYLTSREIWNAWTRTVIDRKNYREQLEITVDTIQREMKIKQQEFEFIDPEGKVLKTLDTIPVPRPVKERTQ